MQELRKKFKHRPRGRHHELPPVKRSKIARRSGSASRRPGSAFRPIAAGGTFHKLSVNGFHPKRINHDKTLVEGKVPVNGFENVRAYAKCSLKAHHGGFNRSFSRVIREGSFRFSSSRRRKHIKISQMQTSRLFISR